MGCYRRWRTTVSPTTTTAPATTTHAPVSNTRFSMAMRSGENFNSTATASNETVASTPPRRENEKENEVTDRTARGDYLPLAKEHTCGAHATTGFILGGEDAKMGEFPFIVILGYKDNFTSKVNFYCAGTLINRRYVLTAAHCHNKNNPALQIRQVVVGEHTLGRDPDCDRGCAPNQVFEVGPDDVTVHPDWVSTNAVVNGNDIALVRLPEPVTTILENVTVRVLPACVKWNPDITVPHAQHIVMGWGRTNNNKADTGNSSTVGAFSSILQKLEVTGYVLTGSTCSEQYKRLGTISGRQFCAGGRKYQGKDSCSGDSGGPRLPAPTTLSPCTSGASCHSALPSAAEAFLESTPTYTTTYHGSRKT